MGWGRGGLHGEGSGGVIVVVVRTRWTTLGVLPDVGSVRGFDSGGGGPVVGEPWKSPEVLPVMEQCGTVGLRGES